MLDGFLWIVEMVIYSYFPHEFDTPSRTRVRYRSLVKNNQNMSAAGALNNDFVEANTKEHNGDGTFRMARNAVTSVGITEVLINREKRNTISHVFSNKIEVEGKATSQKSTGRCWIFAATNLMRLTVMEKYKLPDDFELSQTFLFYWDKFEKSNYFLENIISTLDEDVNGRLVQHLLSDPICDGGQWEMVVNVIRKYGIMPKSVYPETVTSCASRLCNRFITAKLREGAKTLRNLHKGGADMAALRGAKEGILKQVQRVLQVHFGAPPPSFDWCFYDKDKKQHCFPNLTPSSFLTDHVPWKMDTKISLINDPRNPYYKTYTVDKLGNVVGGTPILYLNLPIEELKRYAAATIRAGKPVWFGCEVGKDFYRKAGALDPALFERDLVFGGGVEMTKEESLIYGDSLMTHAMVFTGFDQREGEAAPRQWRVENSWGEEPAEKGFLVMSDAWFERWMYQIVVDSTDIDQALLPLLQEAPTLLPAWDPMGALAGGCEQSSRAAGGRCCL